MVVHKTIFFLQVAYLEASCALLLEGIVFGYSGRAFLHKNRAMALEQFTPKP